MSSIVRRAMERVLGAACMLLLSTAAWAEDKQPADVSADLKNPYSVEVRKTHRRTLDDQFSVEREDDEDPDLDDEEEDDESDDEQEDGESDDELEASDDFDDDADFGGSDDKPTEFLGKNESVQGFSKDGEDEDRGLVAFRFGGYAAADGRVFFLEPRHAGQLRGDTVSLVVEPELTMSIADDAHLFTTRLFYRLDPIDANRSHFDVRKGFYRMSVDGWEAGLGIGQFSWGALDVHRPSDVMNQVDFVERIDGSQKLGQPFVNLGFVGESVALRLYYLPYFRERTFHGIQGRLRPSVVVGGDSELESELDVWHPSGAARLTIVAGDFDFGVGAFTGLSREPRFVAELSSGTIFPRYDQMHQASADATWTYGPVSIKAEGFFRMWSDDFKYFGGGGAGIDYSLFDMFGSGANLTFVGEFLYDSRGPDAPLTFFDHDAFGGLRLAVGDEGQTIIGGGVVADVVDGTLIGRASARRRFWDHWVLSIDGRFYMAKPDQPESALGADSNVEGRVAYFF